MVDFSQANWLGELIPHKTPVTTLGCPIHGFLVENATNVEESIPWTASTVYSVGDFHDDGTHHYEVTAVVSDATSGTSAPSWPTDGSTVQDNNVTWIDRGPTGTIPGVYDSQGGTKEHDAFASGLTSDCQSHNSAQLLQVPGMPAVVRSTAEQASDAANKYHWRNYAILVNNWLHGRQLLWTGRNAEFPTYYNRNDQRHGFIYVDGNGVPWGIEVQSWEIFQSDRWTIQVWLRCLFGRVGRTKPDIMNNGPGTLDGLFIKIADYTTAVGAITAPYPGKTYMQDNDTGFTLTRNSDGSVVFVHLYQQDASGKFRDDAGNKYILRAVVKLEMSGNGLVVDETTASGPLGTGISCTPSLYKDKDDCYATETVNVGNLEDYHPFLGEVYVRRDTYIPETPACDNVSPVSGYDYIYEAIDIPKSPYGTQTENRTTYLWRVGFDASDNIIEIAYRTTNSVYDVNEITFGTPDRNIEWDWSGNWSQSGSVCVPDSGYGSGYALSDSGATSTSIVINYGTEYRYELLRNGSVIDSLIVKDDNERAGTYTGPSTAWRESNPTSQDTVAVSSFSTTSQQIVNGSVDSDSYTVQPHVYSLDVIGLVFENTTQSEHLLSSVATPGGSDDTHQGVTFTSGTYPPLTGAYDPKTGDVVWNVEGLTDLGDGNTFSFV